MNQPSQPSPPDTAGRALSEEDLRIRQLPDQDLLVEFGGLEALMRFTAGASWGQNERVKPLVAEWYQAKLRLYIAEFVRRAAAFRQVAVQEREAPSRMDALLATLWDPDGEEPPPSGLSLRDPCTSPERGGQHEVYLGKAGPYCRACAAR